MSFYTLRARDFLVAQLELCHALVRGDGEQGAVSRGQLVELAVEVKCVLLFLAILDQPKMNASVGAAGIDLFADSGSTR